MTAGMFTELLNPALHPPLHCRPLGVRFSWTIPLRPARPLCYGHRSRPPFAWPISKTAAITTSATKKTISTRDNPSHTFHHYHQYCPTLLLLPHIPPVVLLLLHHSSTQFSPFFSMFANISHSIKHPTFTAAESNTVTPVSPTSTITSIYVSLSIITATTTMNFALREP